LPSSASTFVFIPAGTQVEQQSEDRQLDPLDPVVERIGSRESLPLAESCQCSLESGPAVW